MSKNGDFIFSFLGDEGFRPKRDGDGDIVFKYEGDTYIVIFNENDPDYVSLNKYLSLDFNDNKALEVYKLLNKVNYDYIVGKCVLRDGQDKVLKIEIDTLGSIEAFKQNFDRYLRIIQQMERDFIEDFNEFVS